MNITRTATYKNGKMVYDPPFTASELKRDRDRFNSIVDSRQAPGTTGTDRAFLKGHVLNHNLDDHPPWFAEQIITKAKKAGVSISGKVYKSGLADGRGPADPRAWVSDVHDVMQVAKERNLTVKGVVEHEGHREAPAPDIPLAESMVKRFDGYYRAKDPSLKNKSKQHMREMIIERHGAPAKGRGNISKIG